MCVYLPIRSPTLPLLPEQCFVFNQKNHHNLPSISSSIVLTRALPVDRSNLISYPLPHSLNHFSLYRIWPCQVQEPLLPCRCNAGQNLSQLATGTSTSGSIVHHVIIILVYTENYSLLAHNRLLLRSLCRCTQHTTTHPYHA